MNLQGIGQYLYRLRHLLVAMAIAFALGAALLAGLYWSEKKQNQQLQQVLAKTDEDAQTLVKKLAAVEGEAKVLRHGNMAMRQNLEAQQQVLSEQEKALDFYRQLMDPGSKKQGLALHAYTLQALEAKGQYYFRFTFVQYAKRHITLKASLKGVLHGTVDKQPATLEFSELVNNAEKGWGKLRFKYFQVVEGQLTLPDNFVPERIQLDASVKKKRAKPWQRQLTWLIDDED